MDIKLYITLLKPPANTSYGLQKGSGSNFETVQLQKSAGGDLHFELTVTLKGDLQKDTLPDFKGPFVQGPAGGRFIYIGIGMYAGVTGEEWDGRLKIPLNGITWKDLSATSSPAFETTVPGTDKNGKPNFATVKPFDGWKIKN